VYGEVFLGSRSGSRIGVSVRELSERLMIDFLLLLEYVHELVVQLLIWLLLSEGGGNGL
jgi:hypothetical protein